MLTGTSKGVLCALGAGLAWGLVFVVPLTLPHYPAVLLSCARYLAFGLVSLLPAWWWRAEVAQLTRQDWLKAAELSLVGNLLYYSALAGSIQLAGAAVPTLMVGTLPVVIAIVGNMTANSQTVAWRRLVAPLVVMLLGLWLVHLQQSAGVNPTTSEASMNTKAIGVIDQQVSTLWLGYVLALCAVAAWTWYPIRNAAYLRQHQRIGSAVWATAQGVVTIPMAALGYAIYGAFASSNADFNFPLGDQPLRFVGLMLTLGVLASWCGTLLWNRASQLLPASLAGQMIVFETLAALLYAYAYAYSSSGTTPSLGVLFGIALLVAGVVLGVRVFQPPKAMQVNTAGVQ